MSDIRVPTFSLDAGGATLTVTSTNEWSGMWDVYMPNHLGLSEERRLKADSFDAARLAAEDLAVVLTAAEVEFREMQTRTAAAIQLVWDDANGRRTEGGAA